MSDFTKIPYTDIMSELNITEEQLTPEIKAKITELKMCLKPPRAKGYQEKQAVINNEIADMICELGLVLNPKLEQKVEDAEELKEEVVEHVKKHRTGIFIVDFLHR